MLSALRTLVGGRNGPLPRHAPAPDPALERAARRSTAEYITARMTSARLCSCREEVLDIALERMPGEGLICEFGVFEGQTITYLAQHSPDRRLFGFDSFEGLPEDWRGPFERGVFDLKGRLPRVPSNVELIKGWFSATLPGFVGAHPGPLALLHVDCDLYSSTRCILDHLGERIVPGTIIVFDEYFDYPGWEDHEFRAFREFVVDHGVSYRYLAYNRLHEQVAVEILNRQDEATG
ncbi:MAG: TylF/MycF/NovP-related O-methyltransferase [Geminicoccaceae bacterium]